MSAQPQNKPHSRPVKRARRITAPQITARKGGEPVVCLTAYDAPTAEIMDEHVDLILVGDSLGMVVHGLPSTVGVTLDMMILHGKAVMRGSRTAMVVVDLPFGAYEASGRTSEIADEIVANAKAAADAGSFAVVVEGVSETLANLVTESVDIPTIGIGASALCDGQILVTPDMLGQFDRVPKFVKKYGQQRSATREAVMQYASDVKDRSFPGEANLYHFKKETS